MYFCLIAREFWVLIHHLAGPFLCGVCTISLRLCWRSPGTPACQDVHRVGLNELVIHLGVNVNGYISISLFSPRDRLATCSGRTLPLALWYGIGSSLPVTLKLDKQKRMEGFHHEPKAFKNTSKSHQAHIKIISQNRELLFLIWHIIYYYNDQMHPSLYARHPFYFKVMRFYMLCCDLLVSL